MIQMTLDTTRFSLVRGPGNGGADLIDDARDGLLADRKSLPPKYFYDAKGSRLFEDICATPEYYPTRAEAALLEEKADEIINVAQPTHLVELGSGSAEKTPHLLSAIEKQAGHGVYVPVEISPTALTESAERLLEQFSWLSIAGVCADYEHGLALLPKGSRRLFAFLGSTLGNFTRPAAIRFLRCIREAMGPNDRFLLGADLIKDSATLNAAYNDSQGVTADFNLNVLDVMNRELGANFERSDFRHHAFFNETEEQIEMHVVAERATTVNVSALKTRVEFAAGESMQTEISRKFSRESLTDLLGEAGFVMQNFWTPTDNAFSLSLSATGC